MARYPDGHKDATRARIVDEAASAYREHGLAGIGIQALMRRLGLTHGGFYVHFQSRDDLVAAAIGRAAEDVSERLRGSTTGADAVGQYIDRYLSEQHRDHPGHGCPVAALGAEAPRQSGPVQAALERAARGFMSSLSGTTAVKESMTDEAIGVASVLVGALVLSRALGDGPASKRVLTVGRRIARKLLA
ncbi:MAG: TetR/AcrR family transcriptional regulator [Polyangiaceae bacterium]